MTILDIRGTHGSGKSWLVHQLLKKFHHEPILEECCHIGYHLPSIDAAVIGKYSTQCGGCDGVKTADEVCRRIRLFAEKHRHVVFEGILVSHTFKRYNDLAIELEEEDYAYVFLFLDTPLNKCVSRVRARRLAADNLKPFNPRNLVHDWRQIWKRVRLRLGDAGRCVVVAQHGDPFPKVLEVLDEKLP